MRGCISGSSPSPIRRSSCGGLTDTATGRGQRRGGSRRDHPDVYGVRPPKAAEPGKYRLVIDLIVNGERLNNSVTVHTFEYR